jgi:two-component system response regulator (stage 0 sporulation protein F)
MASKRILIIDDARDVGRMYQQALRTVYPQVPISYVPSAEEAIVEVTTYTVGLMIVDIRLPGMSGFDLVRRVRVRQPDIKVIMITGMRLEDDIVRQSKEVGAARLLNKPISITDLLAVVRETVGDEFLTPPEGDAALDKARIKTAPISNQQVARPAPPLLDVAAVPAPGPSLSEALSGLRGSLSAQAAILLDDTGRVTAQAGNWPEPGMAEKLIPDLMAGLSAAQKVSRQVGAAVPDAVLAFRGKETDLLAAPVGRYVLLLLLKSGPSVLRMALAFEEALLAQKQLGRILGEMGLNILPIESEIAAPVMAEESAAELPVYPAEEPAADQPPVDLTGLEELLGKPAPKRIRQDADKFWDNLTHEETPLPSNPDMLSYEQARKLGLLPE